MSLSPVTSSSVKRAVPSRVLIWSPNYAPELTGIPPLVTDAAEWLAARGHAVEVVTPVPNYPERRIHEDYRGRIWITERRGSVLVHRSWLRVRPQEGFIDKALYEVTASTVALPRVLARLRRTDVLLCVVPTLLAAAYAARFAGRTRLVIWVQDLVLAAAHSMDVSSVGKRVLAAAAALERTAVRGADRIVVCSPGFRDHLVAHGADPARVEVLYNWADLDSIVAAPRRATSDATRFLYAGNLGYTQGLETLIEAAHIGGDGVTVQIVGDGNAAHHVSQLAAGAPNVTVSNPVPAGEFPQLLASHDVHVVIQRRIAAGANLPSKIASYLASGRPVIGSIDAATPAAELLRQSGAALLVEPESPAELSTAMLRLRDGDLRESLGARAREFAESRLGKEAALAQLERALLP